MENLEGVQIPQEINENEKGYYHVLFITSRPNPTTLKFDHEVKKQVINKETFDRCKDTYKQLGYTNMVIFHNPLLQAEEDAKLKAEEDAEAKAKAKEEADAKIKADAEAQAKIDADKKAKEEADKKAEEDAKLKAEAGSNNNSGDEGKLVYEGVEVTTKNVVEFATANNIDVTKCKYLQEKLAIVTIWIEENKK